MQAEMMIKLMDLLTGPIFLASLAIFLVGMLARIVLYIKGLDGRLERVAYSAQMNRGLIGAFASVFKWLIPMGTCGWRKQPLITLGFFLLHIGAIALPFFLVGHTVILENATNGIIKLPSLPMNVADILTYAALAGLVILVVRRLVIPEVRILTGVKEWSVLLLTIIPFVTGLLARITPNDIWTLTHLISAEIFLIVAPFTKLSHIVLYFMSRAQLGMDFAIKRGGHSRGRGPVFPW